MAPTNPKHSSLTKVFQNGMRDFAIAVLGAWTAIAMNTVLNTSSITDFLYRMIASLLIIAVMALTFNIIFWWFSAQVESI